MTVLILGCLIFFGIHSVQIVWSNARTVLVSRYGQTPWLLTYTVLAIVGLVMIVMGYGAARYQVQQLYIPPEWGRSVAKVLLLPVFPLLLATYFPGRLQRIARHPMLWATLLWATAHLLANGSWADVVLFGSFFLWALADLVSFSWRSAREIHRFPVSNTNDWIAVIGGLALYAGFVMGIHRWLTGVGVV